MTTCNDRSGCNARRHGTASAYSWDNCRCADAREAWRLYKKRMREGRLTPSLIDSAGTARRLQALAAIGYNFAQLGSELGLTRRRVGNLAHQTDPRVRQRTADAVDALYQRLQNTPGPSRYARTVARRTGWVPPADWTNIDDPAETANALDDQSCNDGIVDEVAVDRALRGDDAVRIRLNHAERVALARQHHARGGTFTALSRILRCSSAVAKALMAEAIGAPVDRTAA